MRSCLVKCADAKLFVVRRGILIRELNFRELWNLRKFQKGKKYDDSFFCVEKERQFFVYPKSVYEVHELHEFAWTN